MFSPTFFTLLLLFLIFHVLVKAEVQGYIEKNGAYKQGWSSSHCSSREFVWNKVELPFLHLVLVLAVVVLLIVKRRSGLCCLFFPLSPYSVYVAVFWVIPWPLLTAVQLTSLAGIHTQKNTIYRCLTLRVLNRKQSFKSFSFRKDWKWKLMETWIQWTSEMWKQTLITSHLLDILACIASQGWGWGNVTLSCAIPRTLS